MHQEYSRKGWDVLVASAISSICSTFLTNPIEVAKLNLQFLPLNCPSYPHPSYRELIACTCSRFSIAGSIASLKIALPQVLFSNIIYMQIYQHMRMEMIKLWGRESGGVNSGSNSGLNSTLSTILAAASARFIVTTLNVPFQSIRVKLSNEVENKSIGGNFRGYRVTLLRDIIFSTLYWSLLQFYRNHATGGEYRAGGGTRTSASVNTSTSSIASGLSINFLPGFLAGVFVSAVTAPLDTVKTRIQSQGIKNYSIMGSLRNIYTQEHLHGLFAGAEYRMLKNGLHSSIYVMLYEWILREKTGL